MRKRTKRKLIKICILAVLIFLAIIVIKINNKKNEVTKSEVDIKLEKEFIETKKQAAELKAKALSIGKKDNIEILEFVIKSLQNNGIDTNKYWITNYDKDIVVAMKHKGLLVEAGYYKSGTNFNEVIHKWDTLYSKRIINYVDERLEHLKDPKEKIDVVIPSSINEIKNRVFEDNIKLGTVVIPSSVNKIDKKAFNNAEFSEILFNATVDKIDGLFTENTKLEKITFTQNISSISGNAFKNAKIKEVNYLGALDRFFNIYYNMLYDVPSHSGECKLLLNGIEIEEITVPEGVKNIQDYALYNYKNIKKIYLPSTIESIGIFAITGTSINEVVYNGTIEMWNKVEKAEDWIIGEVNCVVYCTDGKVEHKIK